LVSPSWIRLIYVLAEYYAEAGNGMSASERFMTGILSDGGSDVEVRGILGLKSIAVVGMSRDPAKPAHYVPRYLIEHGYRVTPVNPSADEILGLRCYRNLLDIPYQIDIVDVFRPASEAPLIVSEAVKKGVSVVWMQEGIYSREAAELAARNGIKAVWNRCIMKEHRRLLGGFSR